MTKRAEGLRAAEIAADAMLHKFGALSPAHIKVEAYASAFGLTIVMRQLNRSIVCPRLYAIRHDAVWRPIPSANNIACPRRGNSDFACSRREIRFDV